MDIRPISPLEYQTPPDPADRPAWLRRNIPLVQRGAFPFVLFGAAMMLWAARLPVADFIWSCAGAACVAIGALSWLVIIAAPIATRPRLQIFWIVSTPLTIVLLTASLGTDMPSLLMLRAHQPALDRWARQAMNSPNLPTSARVGLYDFYDISPIPGGFRCYLRGSEGFFCEGGLVYSPTSAPSDISCEKYTRALGSWYFLCNDD